MTEEKSAPSHIAVLGAGSWGTALAMLASESSSRITLWTPITAQAQQLASTRQNTLFADDAIPLCSNIYPTDDITQTLDADLILVVVPSIHMRSVAERLQQAKLGKNTVLVSCTKGIEADTYMRMTQILQEYLPQNPIGALAGPNHAEDILHGLPSLSLVGFAEPYAYLAAWVQKALTTRLFRLYTSSDVISMELGGAIKNVFAITAGICAGLRLGDNTLAALVTRGLAEMIRVGVAFGGNADTFRGLSGMGDLVVTCYSKHSRNQRVGEALAQGKKLDIVLAELGMVAEGVPNTKTAYEMARKAAIRTPLMDAAYHILYLHENPLQVLEHLMTGVTRSELE